MNGWSVLRGLFMGWACTGHGGACFAKHSRIKITRVKRRVTAVHRLLSTLLLPTKGRPEQLIGIVSPLLRCHKRCSPESAWNGPSIFASTLSCFSIKLRKFLFRSKRFCLLKEVDFLEASRWRWMMLIYQLTWILLHREHRVRRKCDNFRRSFSAINELDHLVIPLIKYPTIYSWWNYVKNILISTDEPSVVYK